MPDVEKDNKTMMSNIMLVMASAIWGCNFLFQKFAAQRIGAITFMCARTFTGGITLLILIAFMEYARKKKAAAEGRLPEKYGKAYFKKLFIVAPLCVIVNIGGSILVQVGIAYTTVSKAGFLNAIYIIFVPIAGLLLFRIRTGHNVLWGILLATIGLYNLCMGESFRMEKGDLIILLSTLLFAVHIQLVSKYVHELQGLHFSCVEFLSGSVFCAVAALIFEKPTLVQLSECSISILYSGVLGIGICYALQVTVQKYTDPTVAALLMSLESVFSAICGVLILHERFTLKEFVGVLFIIAAIVIAQLPDKRHKEQALIYEEKNDNAKSS